jgi:hypothetical protein
MGNRTAPSAAALAAMKPGGTRGDAGASPARAGPGTAAGPTPSAAAINQVNRFILSSFQSGGGVEGLIEIPELIDIQIIPTSIQRAYALEIADRAMSYRLAFTRSLWRLIRVQPAREWRSRRPGVLLDELAGKTLLVIGWAASGRFQ